MGVDVILCAPCQRRMAWLRIPITQLSSRVRAPRIFAMTRFAGLIRERLHAYKYEEGVEYGRGLAALLAAHWRTEWSARLGEYDVVIPVPLHRARLSTRGYNQALPLARGLTHAMCVRSMNEVSRKSRTKLLVHALQRTRATETQVGQRRNERAANIRGALVVPERYRSHIRGRRCLLVDDVCTTGATLAACARALRRAGARSVDATVIAIA